MSADVSIKYKNTEIAALSATGKKTCKTGGKYCEGDIIIDYVKPPGPKEEQSKTAYPTASDQTISPDSGKVLSSVAVKKVTTSNLSASNIVKGVTVKVGRADDDDAIASVTGTYEVIEATKSSNITESTASTAVPIITVGGRVDPFKISSLTVGDGQNLSVYYDTVSLASFTNGALRGISNYVGTIDYISNNMMSPSTHGIITSINNAGEITTLTNGSDGTIGNGINYGSFGTSADPYKNKGSMYLENTSNLSITNWAPDSSGGAAHGGNITIEDSFSEYVSSHKITIDRYSGDIDINGNNAYGYGTIALKDTDASVTIQNNGIYSPSIGNYGTAWFSNNNNASLNLTCYVGSSTQITYDGGTVTTTNLSAGNIKKGVSILGVTGTYAPQKYYEGSSTPSSSLGSNGDIYLMH